MQEWFANDFYAVRLDASTGERHEVPLALPLRGEAWTFSYLVREYERSALSALSALNAAVATAEVSNLQTLQLSDRVSSSKIEGIHADVDRLRFHRNNPTEKPPSDLEEVLALSYAYDLIFRDVQGRPITQESLRQAHETMWMYATDGHARPGAYRDRSVYIVDSATGESQCVPPPAWMVPHLMSDLFDFMEHAEISSLKKIAVVHHRFEAIHPFADGNGRIGRMLIDAMLKSEGLLSGPFLNLSTQIFKERARYYRLLAETSRSGEFEEWIVWFLRLVTQAAQSSLALLSQSRTG